MCINFNFQFQIRIFSVHPNRCGVIIVGDHSDNHRLLFLHLSLLQKEEEEKCTLLQAHQP